MNILQGDWIALYKNGKVSAIIYALTGNHNNESEEFKFRLMMSDIESGFFGEWCRSIEALKERYSIFLYKNQKIKHISCMKSQAGYIKCESVLKINNIKFAIRSYKIQNEDCFKYFLKNENPFVQDKISFSAGSYFIYDSCRLFSKKFTLIKDKCAHCIG